MNNFKIVIEYDGTNYCGWQRQADTKKMATVQGAVEKALEKVLGDKVSLIGSGRTDAGVHARGQAANFKTVSSLRPSAMRRALATYLPEDIRVKEVAEAPLDFHARYNVKKKWYRYTILRAETPSVFYRNYALFFPYPLDISLMAKAARLFIGEHDFSGIVQGKEKNKVRVIYNFKVSPERDFIYLDVVGNGFLYKMVRRLAGLLLDVGRGKRNSGDVKNILTRKSPVFPIQTAPPQGLTLMEVYY